MGSWPEKWVPDLKNGFRTCEMGSGPEKWAPDLKNGLVGNYANSTAFMLMVSLFVSEVTFKHGAAHDAPRAGLVTVIMYVCQNVFENIFEIFLFLQFF